MAFAKKVASTGVTNLATTQVAPTGVAGTVVVARPTRVSVTIVNIGAVTVYLGPAVITPSTGVSLAPGASRTFSTVGLIQGITASGTGALDCQDEYN